MKRYWLFIAGLLIAMIVLIVGMFSGSGDKRMTSFWFAQEDNPALREDVDGVIEGNVIRVVFAEVKEVDRLIPTFTHTGRRVSVDGVKQTSKKTVNDFSSQIIYTVTAANGSTQEYTVLAYRKDEKGLWPPLPAPRTYDGEIPARSEEVPVERAEFTNIDFIPVVETVVVAARIREERGLFGGTWKVSDETELNKELELARLSGTGSRRIRLVQDGQLVTDREQLQIQKKIPNKLLIIPQREHYLFKPLQAKPHLQIVRYWALADPQTVYRMSPGEGAAIAAQVRVGVDEASRRSFGAAIGAEGEREVKLFNLLVNSQFAHAYLPNERPATESILPVERTIEPSRDYRIAALYRLVHEIRIVNADGQMFSDPNYRFDPVSLKPLIYVDSKDVVAKVYTFRQYKPNAKRH